MIPDSSQQLDSAVIRLTAAISQAVATATTTVRARRNGRLPVTLVALLRPKKRAQLTLFPGDISTANIQQKKLKRALEAYNENEWLDRVHSLST